MPSIDRNSTEPFYQQVYEQIARGIESGLYPAGKKLPSIRECARELGVSNTTVELAYQRLADEGYVQSRRGSGFTICELGSALVNPLERFSEDYRRDQDRLIAMEAEDASRQSPAYDFAYDTVDASAFPFVVWARICREVFFDHDAASACLYNDRQGLRALREQIAHYLSGEYGLCCTPEQILVMPTTRDLVTEIASLFDPAKTVVAMEDPGYDEVVKRLRERGYALQPLRVVPYPTWDEAAKMLEGANVVFATPACQFPSNKPMQAGMRTALVQWAQEHDAYVIDDEYGWEFQSGVARIPPLAALDSTGRVITLGTFSNSFTPAVCLSYAVLPPQLMMEWRARRKGSHPQVPWQTQKAMATFMAEEHWRTHIRKIRTLMHKKRSTLIGALHRHMDGNVEIIEGVSSLFVLVKTLDGRNEDELVRAAGAAGVRVHPTSRYWHGSLPADWRYVLVGYACIPAGSIEEGVRTLAQAWGFDRAE